MLSAGWKAEGGKYKIWIFRTSFFVLFLRFVFTFADPDCQLSYPTSTFAHQRFIYSEFSIKNSRKACQNFTM